MTLLSALLETIKTGKAGITFVRSAGVENYISYQLLYENALSVLGALQHQGLQPGDELVIQMEDNEVFLYLFWACLIGGIIPVPLSTGSQSEQKEKLFKVWGILSRPHLVCTEEQTLRMQKVAGKVEAGDRWEEIERCTFHYEQLQLSVQEAAPFQAQPEDIAYIQFSSGSTGTPKGVCLTHANLISNIRDIVGSLKITVNDSLLTWMPLTHDMGMIGVHLTGLFMDVPVVMIPTALFIRKPLIWMEKVSHHKSSVLYSPNFGLQYFLSARDEKEHYQWDLSCVRIIVNGAEFISAALCNTFSGELYQYGLHPRAIVAAYGLAEASVEVSVMPAGDDILYYYLHRHHLNIGDTVRLLPAGDPAAAAFVDVGFPVSSCTVRICNENDEQLSEDIVGHIQIKGANVTAGYYNDPAATEKAFTADGWLRTGDVGFLHNGRLTITGRHKNIIVINGMNYYPQDIERLITDAGIARLGTVVACGVRNQQEDKEDLVVFVLHKGSAKQFNATVTDTRNVILNAIGLYVHYVIPVKKIPKTTSGKIQHFMLVEQFKSGAFDHLALQEAPEIVADTTTRLLQKCAALLGYTSMDADTNLFAAGMNSITAMMLSADIFHDTGVQVPVEAIFRLATPQALLDYISKAGQSDGSLAITVAAHSAESELSLAQRRLLMEQDMNPASSAYHIPVIYRIKGRFDTAVLEQSFKSMISAYPILRTSFEDRENGPVQIVHEYSDKLFSLKIADIRPHEHIAAYCEEFVNAPFTLRRPSQFRCCVLRIAADEYLLVFVIHHILADGSSVAVLLKDLFRRYELMLTGQPVSDVVTQPEYRDYIQWQKKLFSSGLFQTHRSYWLKELEALPAPVGLAADLLPAAKPGHGPAAGIRFTFEEWYFVKLQELAVRYETTPFCVLMTLLNTLLHRYTEAQDITTGFDVAGRIAPEMAAIQGYMLNTLCLRINVNGDLSFVDLLLQVKEKVLKAIDHQLYPFEQLLAESHTAAVNDLFSVLVLYQNFHQHDYKPLLDGCEIVPAAAKITSCFTPLLIEFMEQGRQLDMHILYNTDIYDAAVIEQFVSHFDRLLRAVSEDEHSAIHLCELEDENIMDDADIQSWAAKPAVAVHALFEKQAAATPEHIAVIAGERQISYKVLNEQANHLAWALKQRYNIKPDDRIGFMIGRKEGILLSILAILKSGAAYVAIDPDLPVNRVLHMVKDSKMKCLLVDDNTVHLVENHLSPAMCLNILLPDPALMPVANPPYEGTANDLAYIIYTSGSTGLPKGVMIEHHSLSHYVSQFIRKFEITGQDIFIQQASVSFDTMVEEIFPPLCTGASVVIAPQGGRDPEALAALIARHKVTVLSTTPLVLQELNRFAHQRMHSCRLLISGGDVLHPAYIDQLFGRADIYNTYGPSETTVCATYHHVTSLEDAGLIGKPVDGYRIYILDSFQRRLPWGKTGEIYIEGGLARGYLGNALLTEEKFIPHPFKPGERLYRTGDKGKFTRQGNIVFAGRADHQLKIRGYRVEPGEIERVIGLFPAISQVAVVLREREQLTAFITVTADFDESALRSFLGDHLPVYMLPQRYEILQEMPLTMSGKIDRQMLAVADLSAEYVTQELAADLKTTAAVLKDVICQVLNTEDVGYADNLFAKGCNSIFATRIISQIYKTLHCKLEIKDIFLYPTITGLAGRVRSLTPLRYESIVPVSPAAHYELSPAQLRLWILHQMEKDTFAYNEGEVFEISGNIDPELVRQTFMILVKRHEVLRTTFCQVAGVPRQIVHPATGFPLPFMYTDVSGSSMPYEEGLRSAGENIRMPFDLENGPLFRVVLVKVTEDKHLCAVLMHHIVTDDRSGSLLMKEFIEIYSRLYQEGSYTEPDEQAITYKDYVQWNKHLVQQQQLRNSSTYWMHLFSDRVPVLELPYDISTGSSRSAEGARAYPAIDTAVFQEMQLFCRQQEISLFMLLLSGLGTLLARYTGQYDMIIGTPVSGRIHADVADMPGFFVNMLPLRLAFNEDQTLHEIVAMVKQRCLDAYSHQAYPFDTLVNELNIHREAGRSPMFDVMINLHTVTGNTDLVVPGHVVFRKIKRPVVSYKYDLSYYFEEQADSLSLVIEYNPGRFTAAYIERMAIHFVNIIRAFVSNGNMTPGDIDFLSAWDKKTLLLDFNNRKLALPEDKDVIQLFRRQVALAPYKNAITCKDKTYTYKELDEVSDLLARQLIIHGNVKPGDLLGLLLERSEKIIVAILAIWKAGAAYMPIDPAFPEERVCYMIADAGVAVVLTEGANLDICEVLQQWAAFTPVNMDKLLHYEIDVWDTRLPMGTGELAYVIYTSGSTGHPKGVEICHDSLKALLLGMEQKIGAAATDIFLAVSTYTFDISVFELFLPLMVGGRTVIATREQVIDARMLRSCFDSIQPTIMEATPGLWKVLLGSGWKGSGRLKLITCGEALPDDLRVQLLNCCDQLWNLYGPTEGTIFATGKRIFTADEAITIGGPLFNTTAYILDNNRRLVPMGVTGELYIGGSGIAKGYRNNGELTERKFLYVPGISDERLYATGDIARWLPDGTIEYKGRADEQVKIRGFRIEPGEIENVMLRNAGIAAAAVIVRSDGNDNAKLIAYYVPATAHTIDSGKLSEYLKRQLPAYMLPEAIHAIESIPLNANGKTDKRQLMQLNAVGINTLEVKEIILPASHMETALHNMWKALLGTDQIGVSDNFFHLGGHSLRANQLVNLIFDETGVEIRLMDIFHYPTIRELAELLEKQQELQYNYIELT